MIFEPTIFADLGGVYFALLAALSMSVSLIFMKKLDNIKVFDLQAWIAVISCLMLFMTSYIFESNQINVIVNANVLGWSAVIFTALVATGIGHAGFYYLITKYELSKITPLTLLAPVLAIINALVISYFSIFDNFDEIISLKIIIGSLCTLIGVGIVMTREEDKRIIQSP